MRKSMDEKLGQRLGESCCDKRLGELMFGEMLNAIMLQVYLCKLGEVWDPDESMLKVLCEKCGKLKVG
jgi:hypothetical protein